MKRLVALVMMMVLVFAFAALAGNKTVDVKVKGMTCDACVKKVQTSLEKVEGVTSAKVDLEKEVATVTYDDTKAKNGDFEKAVKDAGFKVEKSKAKSGCGGAKTAGCCGSK